MESTPFHVEYRWKKIIKMGEISAKTYSMWNGQIPCGIRGHGKDLTLMVLPLIALQEEQVSSYKTMMAILTCFTGEQLHRRIWINSHSCQ